MTDERMSSPEIEMAACGHFVVERGHGAGLDCCDDCSVADLEETEYESDLQARLWGDNQASN
jgi:hypothetical protein